MSVRSSLVLGALALLALGGCATTRTYVAAEYEQPAAEPPAADLAYEVYLVGNLADGESEALAPALHALERQLQRAGENSAVVFLGDVTPAGLPEATAAGWAEAEARLSALAATVDGYDGRVFVVPGDRDWAQGEDGVERLEDYLEARLDRGDVVAPGDARPGPLVLDLTDDLTLVALDTAWWLTGETKPTGDAAKFDGDEGDYEVENEYEVVLALEDALRDFDADEENLLVVGHHPLKSNGPYGGHSTLGQHLLPPVLGSVVPLYRQFVGGGQDLANRRYRAMRQALGEVFLARHGVVYAAAHERSLQLFPVEESIRRTQHYLVSGSVGEGAPVVSGRGAAFASSRQGYMRVRYHESGATWLDVFAIDEATGEAEVALSTRLRAVPRENVDPEVPEDLPPPPPADSTVTEAVNPDLAAGSFKRLFLGSGYRDAWTTPVAFPVLDLTGLRPVKRGGGMQTVSLRLEREDGQQYVLRLLNKIPGRTLPEDLRRSVIADIIQDLTSGTIPWGALAAAELAEAVGLYHTTPRLVYVPDDPRLGTYREDFAGRLALFEIRPDDDMSDYPQFGRAEDVVSYPDMIEEMEDDNDHRMDQRFFLRNRLLDWLLSDWDRHPDQWRFAAFEPYELDPSLEGDARTDGKVYRPIPRDRDFAFYSIDGVIPFVARQFMPKLQTFGGGYGNLAGLTTSGIPIDRRFTGALTREDWLAEAEDFQASLTDAEIEAAVRLWPDPIYDLYGERTVRLLKERRAEIVEVAGGVYDLYADIVDVVGSNRRERFEVTRLDGGALEVVVYDSNEEGERNEVLYRRTLRPDETGEVRIYGLDGGDFFFVQGDGPARIRVRIIGGAGEDTFTNTARGGSVFYYDTEEGNEIAERGRARVRLSDRALNNRYDPLDFKHGVNAVLLRPGYNRTDGFILGAGYVINRPSFRRYPWAAVHTLTGSYATTTSGVRGHYAGRFFDVLGPDWDTTLDLAASTPRYVRNFYGFGNETTDRDQPSDFFHVDLLTTEGEVSLIRRVESLVQGRIGAGVSYVDVEEGDEGDPRFIDQAGLPASAFEGQLHAHPFVELTLQNVDVEANPRQGFRWTGRAALHAGLNDPADTFGALSSALAFYVSPSLSPQLTLTGRLGGGHNVGDFPFFAAQTLGGERTVRGLVRQRYSGRTVLYQNVEARLALFEAFASFIPATVGVLGFVDNGRVWADDEPDDDGLFEGWHQGYGGGLWFGVLDRFVLSGTAASGDDGVLVNVGLRFLY
ncbi:MAG: hypothetical protein R3181_03330 [Rubricoccaceae bacterium]|nr:hypothetical protein [Rubricoccaceae bacterium]